MRPDIVYGSFALMAIVSILIGIITSDVILPLPMPVIPFFTCCGLVFFFILFREFELWRWKTCQVLFPIRTDKILGHCSIRAEDIIHRPWELEIDKEGISVKFKLDMTIMFTGGTNYSFYSAPGLFYHPVLIFLEYNEEEIVGNYVCHANLGPCDIEELKGNIFRYLERNFPIRVKRAKTTKILWWTWVHGGTPVFFGLTSNLDGTATSENLYFEEQLNQSNKTIKILLKEVQDREQLLQRKEGLNKNKDVLIAERVKNHEERT